MKTLLVQTLIKPAILAKKLFKFERCGRYEDALEELSEIWPEFELAPRVDDFVTIDAAEIILRCGSLIGFHGHNAQLPGAQERSRDLLMAAQSRFLAAGNIEKIAECENYIALSYWRTGEQNEAQIWIEESFSRDLAISNPVRLFSHIIQSLINIPAKKYSENLEKLRSLEDEFLGCDDDCLKGDFYNHCALALKNLDKKTEALGQFELARYYHQRSRHKIYLATVENNLANLYREMGRFQDAHESIDNATRIFKQIKDKTREGFSLDTKALVYFAESKYDEALRTADKALVILRKSENTSYQIETALTKAKVLLYLDDFPSAVFSLIEAVDLARKQTGEASAIGLINEFEAALNERNTPNPKGQAVIGDLELVLPAALAKFDDYRGVWINNTHLENIGLAKGSLAIVVKTKISRGDLVAVSEFESEQVNCGYYDADFGVICLESPDGDPQLFNEKDIRILGKIVGVCRTGRAADGKMVVESLKL